MKEEDVTDRQTEENANAAMLRWLRGLVTGLAVVMGVGLLTIVAIIWMRLGPGAEVTRIDGLPEGFVLPQTTQALTLARDWIIVVTDKGEVLFYDRKGELQQQHVLPQ